MEKDEDNKLKTTEAKQTLDNRDVSRRAAEEMPNGGGKGREVIGWVLIQLPGNGSIGRQREL